MTPLQRVIHTIIWVLMIAIIPTLTFLYANVDVNQPRTQNGFLKMSTSDKVIYNTPIYRRNVSAEVVEVDSSTYELRMVVNKAFHSPMMVVGVIDNQNDTLFLGTFGQEGVTSYQFPRQVVSAVVVKDIFADQDSERNDAEGNSFILTTQTVNER